MQVELCLSFASGLLQIDLMIFDAAWEIANHARWHHLFFSPALLFIPIPKILVLERQMHKKPLREDVPRSSSRGYVYDVYKYKYVYLNI